MPQGTVLGPVLFLCLIASISDGTDSNTRVSFSLTTPAPAGASTTRMTSTSCSLTWRSSTTGLERWTLEFNGTSSRQLGAGQSTITGPCHIKFQFWNEWTYNSCSGGEIEEKDHVKDFGVMPSSDLTFFHHIKKVVETSWKQSGFIFRTWSRGTMMTLWTTMIQSRLDYCN